MKRAGSIIVTAVTLFGIGCSSDHPVALQMAEDNPAIVTTGSLRLNMSNSDGEAGIAKMMEITRNGKVDSVDHIWLTIKEVQLHIASDPSENGWKTVATPNKQIDFLDLVNGLTAPLDLYALPAGHYTQIRLFLGDDYENYYGASILANCIVIKGESYPITIPSAWRTGIKCVRSIFIEENETTEICLSFDIWSAIHYSAGNGYMMRPAFRTFKCDGTDEETTGETADVLEYKEY